LIEQTQRHRFVADFIGQIVRNAAIGVDVEKMLAQAARQKPGSN